MNQTRTIRLPIHVVKELNVYLRAARELTQKLDHEPSAEEIADLLDKPVEDVKRLLVQRALLLLFQLPQLLPVRLDCLACAIGLRARTAQLRNNFV